MQDQKLESLENFIFWTCKNGNFFSEGVHILVLQVFGLSNLQKQNMDFLKSNNHNFKTKHK